MRHHYATHVDPDTLVIKDGHAVDYRGLPRDQEIIRDPEVRKHMRPTVADLGHTAQFLADRGITLTNKARDLFLDCVLLNVVPALLRLEQNAGSDYSPDDLPKTFPQFELNRAANAAAWPTPMELFEAWVTRRKPKHSTVESWRTMFRALTKQFQATPITPDQAQAWLDGLLTKERSSVTVRNWLKATKTVYTWALRRRLVSNNPFQDVIVEKHKRPQHRPKHLYDHEIITILKAASAVTDATSNPDVAARR
jgi:hypothetical protein